MTTDSTIELRGFVRWYDANLGYGFVTDNMNADRRSDAFLHKKNMRPVDAAKNWPDGTRARYKIRSTAAGKLEAYDITMEK